MLRQVCLGFLLVMVPLPLFAQTVAVTTAAAKVTKSSVRISQEQATEGWSIPVTYDLDQVIKFEGDRIANVWSSHNLLFNIRFAKGGKVIVLQANAAPQDMSVLPEMGRALGTLTIEMEGGAVLIFKLVYTTQPKSQLFTVYRAAPPRPTIAAPGLLNPLVERAQPVIRRSTGRVSQDGFSSPLQTKNPEPIAISSTGLSVSRSIISPGYWLLDQGTQYPESWSNGPDTAAYRAFFALLQRGKEAGFPFEQSLAMAQKLSGVDDRNLIWLARTLAQQTPPKATETTASTAQPKSKEAIAPGVKVEPEPTPDAKKVDGSGREN